MKCKCPACGSQFSLDVLVANESASQALNAALLINGDLGRALISYLGLFRPAKSSLTFDRVTTLLNELTPMINSQTIQRNGREFYAPVESWIYAINQILANRQTLKLPMKSHGYLLEIIASYKSTNSVVAVQNNVAQNRQIVNSNKMNTVKEALAWANINSNG
ncbi:hypothetical protein CEP49_06645 [Mergibacter septicus]|uniref:hypothetical protein n=1 Tax=Mergibacter septicus TaxID=221402 RepID=UPI0011796F9F|nr:hypothetical protein [Mergibacter septicus]AWX14249.1 hypothetical protein CEP49_06645 [Mergibacter septicus]